MADLEVQYFLGANSPSGFYSLYDQLLPRAQARALYILKGGPGCGKSTLMRTVSRQLTQAGLEAEYILCSGDPQSLDAVLFPQLGAALVDGTAPHVVEPKYPGVVDRYVDLGSSYDLAGLRSRREEIMAAMDGYKSFYPRAYRCLGAAASITEDARSALLTEELSQRMARRAAGILSREIRPRRGVEPGQVKQRFLGAVSCQGTLCLYDTALAQCGKIYELADRYSLAHPLLSHLLAGAVRAGYDVVACPDPMAPDRLAHLLIPQLSLAFLSSDPAHPFPGEPFRRLRLDAMADQDLLRRLRPRLRFTRKVSDALMEEAVACMAQAKETHDALEQLYNPFVDFDQVNASARAIAEELMEDAKRLPTP